MRLQSVTTTLLGAHQTPATPLDLVQLTRDEAARFPLLWQGGVAVVGGGSAGSAAALSAARHNVPTIVIEEQGFLGGTGAAVLDTMYGFFAPGGASRVVGGVAWEIADALLSSGQAILRENTYGAGTGVTYEPEALKRLWDATLLEAGVMPLLHARARSVIIDDGTVTGLIVDTRRGPFRVDADCVIDASGDGYVAWASGCSLEMPSERRRTQPLTTTFRLGGVDGPASTAEMHALMRASAESGDYVLPRLEGSIHRTVQRGVYHANVTRVSGVDATEPWAIAAAEIEGRRQVSEYTRFLTEAVPGYRDAFLMTTSVWIGARESRRLVGEYVLTRDDVMQARQFDDAIALCGAPIEDHDGGTGTIWKYVGSGDTGEPTGLTYGVPYRTLVPVGVDGLLVSGRCFSATHTAHASARSIAQCLSYGQAAGTAAALAIDSARRVRDVDTDGLRQTLSQDGVILA